jgi:peptide methionine sulfoxide reductase MsrA
MTGTMVQNKKGTNVCKKKTEHQKTLHVLNKHGHTNLENLYDVFLNNLT